MKSPWQTCRLPVFPTLKGDISTDVLIVGGGLCGLLTARFLRDSGVDCLVVERDRIAQGTTGHTTGKITAQHGLIYHKLLKTHGHSIARAYYDANTAALAAYAGLAESIDCDFERRDNVVYSLTDPRPIEQELRAMSVLGIPGQATNDLPLPFSVAGAVLLPEQAEFHPCKFIMGLIQDLRIYENTPVLRTAGSYALTPGGRIHAEKIIIATHFPILNKRGLYWLKLYQQRSYMIALRGAPPLFGMYVDADPHGMSFRSYSDLLFLGGGGARPGRKTPGWESLRSFAKEHYPDAVEVYAWATQDCMSLDGIPYIGRYSPQTPDHYVATGFNKWGMTGSMVAALLLRDLLLGRENPYLSLFSPARSSLHPQLALNALEAAADLLTPLPRRCPHLGCALHYNKAEHTWDCPCHGSRFAEDGTVLNPPANGNLTPGFRDREK